MKQAWKRIPALFACVAILSAFAACSTPETGDNVLFDITFGDGTPVFAPGAGSDCKLIGVPSTPVHADLLAALNDYRTERGLSPLVYSRRLEAAADAHLKDMATRHYFAHETPEGLDPTDRAVAAGFCHHYVGENLAAGQNTVERVMEAWHASESHRRNLTEPDFVYVGIGYYVDANGRKYWAQLFAFEYTG